MATDKKIPKSEGNTDVARIDRDRSYKPYSKPVMHSCHQCGMYFRCKDYHVSDSAGAWCSCIQKQEQLLRVDLTTRLIFLCDRECESKYGGETDSDDEFEEDPTTQQKFIDTMNTTIASFSKTKPPEPDSNFK